MGLTGLLTWGHSGLRVLTGTHGYAVNGKDRRYSQMSAGCGCHRPVRARCRRRHLDMRGRQRAVGCTTWAHVRDRRRRRHLRPRRRRSQRPRRRVGERDRRCATGLAPGTRRVLQGCYWYSASSHGCSAVLGGCLEILRGTIGVRFGALLVLTNSKGTRRVL